MLSSMPVQICSSLRFLGPWNWQPETIKSETTESSACMCTTFPGETQEKTRPDCPLQAIRPIVTSSRACAWRYNAGPEAGNPAPAPGVWLEKATRPLPRSIKSEIRSRRRAEIRSMNVEIRDKLRIRNCKIGTRSPARLRSEFGPRLRGVSFLRRRESVLGAWFELRNRRFASLRILVPRIATEKSAFGRRIVPPYYWARGQPDAWHFSRK